ncbi:MAG: hypothetical protein WAL80_01080 [Xanthobacteraceae bacterium]
MITVPPLFFGPTGSLLGKPEDVIDFLGKGKEHWKAGRSAYEAAYSWFMAKDLPPRIRAILEGEPAFGGAVLDKAVFEKNTRLDHYGRDSQTDVLAYLNTDEGLAVIGVEAKVDESFGPLVREWNDYGTGKLRRLVGLLNLLEFKSTPIDTLRYQLFHRTAATVIEARSIGARDAAMIVQSFDKKQTGFDDFIAFAEAFDTPVSMPGKLSAPKTLGEVTIRLGWTENPIYSTKS